MIYCLSFLSTLIKCFFWGYWIYHHKVHFEITSIKLDTRFIFIIHSTVKITHTVKQVFTTI